MRLKSFTAPNMSKAMRAIHLELAEDAIIISTQNNKDGSVNVMAAVEEEEIYFNDEEEVQITTSKMNFDDSIIRDCLTYHDVVDVLQHRILSMVRNISTEYKTYDDKALLEKCFANIFSYKDILDLRNRIKIFVGVTGSGKSTAIAKAATQAKIKGVKTLIISTDNVRAGANKQLEAFADILETDFVFVKGDRNLYEKISKIGTNYDLILVDTPGINPFIEKEVQKVGETIDTISGDVILTLDSGRNTYEAIEISEMFSKIGAKFLLPTRLDMTRRIGSIISVAGCCGLSFCSASVSSSIAKGLATVDNKSLAKLILA